MQSPRPRFSVRWLMIAVAVVVVPIELGVLWKRRVRYLDLAHQYSVHERVAREHADMVRATKMDRSGKVLLDVFPSRLAHYSRMRAKDERAARYPWRLVVPAPQERE